MTGTGDNFVNLETRQLATFTRLGSLGHLNLYFFCIYQILRGNSESSRSNLFGLAAQADGFAGGLVLINCFEACTVLTTFTGIASCSQRVHGQCHCFVCFLADGTERHGTRYKMPDNIFHRFYLRNVNRVTTESEKVAYEYGRLFLIRFMCKLLKFLVASGTRSQLQQTDCIGIPCMLFSILAVREETDVVKLGISICFRQFGSAPVQFQVIVCYVAQSCTAQC